MKLYKRIILYIALISIAAGLNAENKAAVIVGVNDYDVLTDLNAGVNDAEKMAAYYKGLGFKVYLISDRQEDRKNKPSMQNFERVLDNIRDLSADQSLDELVFFFAGHGVLIEGKNYLCFPETEVTKKTGMLSVDDTLVPWLKDVKADLSMVYLDACRNELGPMRAAGVERGLEVKGLNKGHAGDIAILYAAKPGSFSYEKPDGTNGFFTDTLMEALQSPETNSISSLYGYLRTALPERTEAAYGRPQIPHMGGDFDMTVSFSKGQVDLGSYDTSAKVFVEASEVGAKIKINGIVRGETPALIEGVNPGNVLIEVEKDGKYASKQVALTSKAFEKLTLELEEVTGDILVNSMVSFDADNKSKRITDIPQFLESLDVFVDGQKIESISSGLISSIPPGGRDIVIKGSGWYWEERVTIEENNAIRVEVELYPVGDFIVEAGEGVYVKMKNIKEGYEILSDISETSLLELTDIPVGVWKVSVMKNGYHTKDELIEIYQGEKLTISPELEKKKSFAIEAELASLRATNIVLNKDYSTSKSIDSKRWISRGIGTALLGVAGYFVYSSYDNYTSYDSATDSEDAEAFRESATTAFNIAIGSAIGGISGFIVPLFIRGETPGKIKPLLKENENRIQELEAELEAIGEE